VYTESSGWLKEGESKIITIGDCIGSASLKQVMIGKTKDGRIIAIKVIRPNIAKNLGNNKEDEESNSDIAVLNRVLRVVEKKGFGVQSFLVPEVCNSVYEELSLHHEVDNQMAMKASLTKRNASLRVSIGASSLEIPLSISAPLSVSDVLYPTPENKEDIGLMVPELNKVGVEGK
jgi:acetolactate synthase regulatory subunit